MIYSRIVDPVSSVTKVDNVQSATQLLAQTTLRNILGTKTLQEILSDRENIAHAMQTHLDEGTGPWGVKVERVEMYVVVVVHRFVFTSSFRVELTFVFLNQCNVQWLLKLKRVEKLEQK